VQRGGAETIGDFHPQGGSAERQMNDLPKGGVAEIFCGQGIVRLDQLL
jgi:hypothetical protein